MNKPRKGRPVSVQSVVDDTENHARLKRALGQITAFLVNDLMPQLDNGWDHIMRFHEINRRVRSAHSDIARALGRPRVFSLPANKQLLELENLMPRAERYLCDEAEPVHDRFLLACLLVRTFRGGPDWRLVVQHVNGYLSGAGLPIHMKEDGNLAVNGDEFVEEVVEEAFWDAVAGDEWLNVRVDLQEAYLILSTGGPGDPVFLASRGLESALKVAAHRLGVLTDDGRGAGDVINKLASAKHANFISQDFATQLRHFF